MKLVELVWCIKRIYYFKIIIQSISYQLLLLLLLPELAWQSGKEPGSTESTDPHSTMSD